MNAIDQDWKNTAWISNQLTQRKTPTALGVLGTDKGDENAKRK
jgi:hypothetical protein